MAWVRVDDHFDEHPKMATVGPLGWGVWLKGLAYCNRNLTDGFIPRAVAHSISDFKLVGDDDRLYTLAAHCGMSGDDITPEWVIAFLVDAGVWTVVPGGYRVHDYEDYQLTKGEILAERAKVAERVRRHRNGSRNPVTNAPGIASGNAVSNSAPKPKPKEVIPSSSNSSTGSGSAPPVDDEKLWLLVADRQMSRQPAGSVRNPTAWLKRAARNAQSELAERAGELRATYDVPLDRLAECLADGGTVPASWTYDRR